MSKCKQTSHNMTGDGNKSEQLSVSWIFLCWTYFKKPMDTAVSIALLLLFPDRHENTKFASGFGLSIPYLFRKSAEGSSW